LKGRTGFIHLALGDYYVKRSGETLQCAVKGPYLLRKAEVNKYLVLNDATKRAADRGERGKGFGGFAGGEEIQRGGKRRRLSIQEYRDKTIQT